MRQEAGSHEPELGPRKPSFPCLEKELEAIGEARGAERGQVHSEAQALLTVLSARQLAVDDATRARILDCKDLGLLETWIRCAATATSLGAVFNDT